MKPELSEDGEAGFNFLGFHIQQYKVGRHKSGKNSHKKLKGYVTLITPTKKSRKKQQEKIGEVIRKHISKPIDVLIKNLNPVIKGWMNYYKYSDIKTTGICSKMDDMMFSKLRSWAKRRCGTVKDGLNRYYHIREYTMLNGKKSHRKEWADYPSAKGSIAHYGDVHCSSTKYVKVQGIKSPYDGDIRYWSKRLQSHPELSTRELKLLKNQKGKCNWCGLHFMDGVVMEVDHIIPKSKGGKDRYDNLQLLHGHCHDSKTLTDSSLNKKQKFVTEEYVDFW